MAKGQGRDVEMSESRPKQTETENIEFWNQANRLKSCNFGDQDSWRLVKYYLQDSWRLVKYSRVYIPQSKI